MKTIAKYPVAIVCIFTWIGFVCAISFMEAWLKFRAPGITVPLGLGIGRLVFAALNKVEWVFAIVVLLTFLSGRREKQGLGSFVFAIPVVILLLQTCWLLPALDARATLLLSGGQPAASSLHLYFFALEIL